MSVTNAVFHELMFWLKLVAPLNMLFMFTTDDVFHKLKSALNVVEVQLELDAWNSPAMSLTPLTSQFAIPNPLPSVHEAPVGAAPPRQYEDAIVFTSSAFNVNGDAYVHAVSPPGATSPARRNRPLAHAKHTPPET
jgi:hypothetical protein